MNIYTRNKITTGVLVALFVVAGVGVGLGMWATYDEDSPIRELMPDPAFIPDVPTWQQRQLPLSMCATAYQGTLGGNEARSVASAVATTNDRLGWLLFTVADEDCDINMVVGIPRVPGDDPDGNSHLVHRGPEVVSCEVVVRSGITGELLSLTVQHELGHCLGLAHDDFSASIMRDPHRFPLAVPADLQFPIRLTDRDVAAIRERYR